MKYGICGGSYDPVHLGHLYIWNKAIESLALDYLFIIPTFISPLKSKTYFENNVRYKLLELAIEDYKDIYGDNAKLVLIDFEIQRSKPSYTIDTIDYLYSKYDFEEKPYFVIGSDTSNTLEKWYEIESLSKKLCFAVIPRAGYPVTLAYDSIALEVEPFRASSTSFRKDNNFDILSKRVKSYVKAL